MSLQHDVGSSHEPWSCSSHTNLLAASSQRRYAIKRSRTIRYESSCGVEAPLPTTGLLPRSIPPGNRISLRLTPLVISPIIMLAHASRVSDWLLCYLCRASYLFPRCNSTYRYLYTRLPNLPARALFNSSSIRWVIPLRVERTFIPRFRRDRQLRPRFQGKRRNPTEDFRLSRQGKLFSKGRRFPS